MLRDEQIVGSLVVRRKTTGDFSEETLDLLETFASQSALALLNAVPAAIATGVLGIARTTGQL